MKILHATTGDASVVTLSGDIGASDTDRLRGAAYEALAASADAHRHASASQVQLHGTTGGDRQRDHAGDLLVDASAVTSFDDAAMAALSSARTRARHLGAQIVVTDQVDGALSLSLRRTGLAFRFPQFESLEAATAFLEQARAARIRLDMPMEAKWRAVR
ncbi:hypothetical protein FHN55_10885 [Streptomyces sp. NP160]|uniref:STAS domain-containing protein n=1 Tax=Streptomyces sp. NP160 TaxID=2586637 RepID=UPI001119D101|nr:STAS domain-containing protein [Streptomyces sp. NP160]TNM67296.1 hypothetical protein FHN55_10885 [Streptomyces sp. NP160]